MKRSSEFFKPLMLLAVLAFGFITTNAPAQGAVTIGIAAPAPPANSGQLINVDLGAAGGRGYSLKTGFAAIGQATNDFWNFYDRDASSTPYDWRSSETLMNVKAASGAPTTVGVSISDAPGAWGDASSDPMYATYDYPLDGGNNVVTFTNLPAGQYDVLAYSVDGNYEVSVGGTSYGVKTTYDSPVSTVPVWTEGVQYARWRNVTVAAGQPLVLTVRNGVGGYAILSGVQILSDTPATPDCTPAPSGLVGWWKGDGNTLDSFAGNTGVNQNITYTNGVVGQAFACDPENYPYGTYTGIQIADQPAYALTNSLTIEGWVRPRGDGYIIFFRGDHRPGLDPYILSMQANNTLLFGICDADGNGATVETTLNYFAWTHVAATLDGSSGALSIYTNGVLAAKTLTTIRPFGALLPDQSPGVGIGNLNDGGNNFPFIGDIDEIALYSRALSATEIAAIYNAGSSGKCPSIPVPPVADASATVPLVISVNNSNATVVLNGSLSSDPNGKPLQYTWYQTGSPNPLATGVIAVVVLPVGTNSITLVVNDGPASSQQTILVAVITLAQAVDQLEAVVNDADISHKQSLIASLNAALGAIDRSNPTAAINQLQAFQNKVTAQISPVDPALAQTLIDEAQSIINALSGGAASHKGMKATAQANGKIHLNFSGIHQQVYIIEASTNLVDWEMIGVAQDLGDGTFDFDDADAPRIPQRYYRVVAP